MLRHSGQRLAPSKIAPAFSALMESSSLVRPDPVNTCGPAEAAGQGLACQMQQCRWASKKQGGSTQNGKDSNPKMLGVKLFGGQQCIPGNIIIRQRGTKFHPGANVGAGKDHTIFATAAGKVKFHYHKLTKRRYVGVEL